MARTPAVALTALILSSMALLALASVPVVKNKATQGTTEQQRLQPNAARKLLAIQPTYWQFNPGFGHDSKGHPTSDAAAALPAQANSLKVEAAAAAAASGATSNLPLPFRRLQASTPTFDRDLEDRSAAVANPTLAAAVKRLEADSATGSAGASNDDAIPFRRLLGESNTSDRDLEDRSAAVVNPALVASEKRLQADTDTNNAGEALPFRRLQASTPTFDRDLEDRSAAVANPTLAAAVKRLEADSATGNAGASIDGDTIPFRRLQASTPTFDRDLKDRSAAVANPTLAAAVKRLQADAASSSAGASAGEALPFRRLLARDHTSDRDLEDRSAAVADPLLQSAYKRFEAAQAAGGGSTGTPFRRLLSAN